MPASPSSIERLKLSFTGINDEQKWIGWLTDVQNVFDKPKCLLSYWDFFFIESLDRLQEHLDSHGHHEEFLSALKYILKGSRGFFNSRMRYEKVGVRSAKPFTSLADSVLRSMRSLWAHALSHATSSETWFALIILLAEYNHMAAFLTNGELREVLEDFCWKMVDIDRSRSFLLASHAAKHIKDCKDTALALKYISIKANLPHYPSNVWCFFLLLEPDDQETFVLALSFLPRDFEILKSIKRIVESCELSSGLIKTVFESFVVPHLVRKPIGSDNIVPFLECLKMFLMKLDLSGWHSSILEHLSLLDEIMVLDILGLLVDHNYPYPVEEETYLAAYRIIYNFADCPKKVWALANFSCNPGSPCKDEIALELFKYVRCKMDDWVDEQQISSAIRILGSCAEHKTNSDSVFGILETIDTKEPKIAWTLANALSNISRYHSIPLNLIEKMLVIFEETCFYKVAISVGQCLHTILTREHCDFGDRIKKAIASQRFTITDVYNEKYVQALRKSNAALLNMIDT